MIRFRSEALPLSCGLGMFICRPGGEGGGKFLSHFHKDVRLGYEKLQGSSQYQTQTSRKAMQESNFSKSTEASSSANYFSRNLRFLRKQKGLSQQKLAEQLGLNRNNIASYEAGVVEPRPERFLEIARYFDTTPRQFLTEDLSETPAAQPAEKPPETAEEIYGPADAALICRMAELKKMLEGFQAFHELKKQHYDFSHPDVQSLSNDLENLMEMVRHLSCKPKTP